MWPRALREGVAEDEHFRNTPQYPVDDGGLDDADWHRQQQEADIVHRLLGLVGYAANPRNIDLSDLTDLAAAISDLQSESQQAAKIRR
ncbi:hypothetical protein [Streptomyces sp. 2A115]|uniref:hypothetical protein n=1 Tax=Streptomyces sp. 2A115 TaxID=3457439 RepID=UPI003FCF0ED9